MMKKACWPSIPIILFCFIFIKCHESSNFYRNSYIYSTPNYDSVGLKWSMDTLSFGFENNVGNKFLSFNLFSQNGLSYISFIDKKSESLNLYDFSSGKLIKRILLKNCFSDHDVYHPSSYVRSFDSIFIVNRDKLYLLDTAGKISKTINFIKSIPSSWALFENDNPLFIKGTKLYLAVRPEFNEGDLSEIKTWKIFYEFDLTTENIDLYYHFPEQLQRNVYGFRMLSSSYCYNDKGNFVVSFTGDSNVYETDLREYNFAYFAKSRFQKTGIRPITDDDVRDRRAYGNYLTSDTYSSIYFDVFSKRYLRVVRRAISKRDYLSYKWDQVQSVLILDQNFKIIGESSFSPQVGLDLLFFTPDGEIFARVNESDKKKMHFLRLIYYDPHAL